MLIHTHTVDFSSFISSQTESAENSGHIKYIVQFIEKGKKKKIIIQLKQISEVLPASENMKKQKEQIWSFWQSRNKFLFHLGPITISSVNKQTDNSRKHKWGCHVKRGISK